MELSDMIQRTRDLIALFHQIEPRHWGIEAMTVELAGEVGTLADSIMITEGFRSKRDGIEPDISDDIADIMFMLIRVADNYNIDIEQSYKQMLEKTKEKLLMRLSAR